MVGVRLPPADRWASAPRPLATASATASPRKLQHEKHRIHVVFWRKIARQERHIFFYKTVFDFIKNILRFCIMQIKGSPVQGSRFTQLFNGADGRFFMLR